jgi:hypothetical protein
VLLRSEGHFGVGVLTTLRSDVQGLGVDDDREWRSSLGALARCRAVKRLVVGLLIARCARSRCGGLKGAGVGKSIGLLGRCCEGLYAAPCRSLDRICHMAVVSQPLDNKAYKNVAFDMLCCSWRELV